MEPYSARLVSLKDQPEDTQRYMDWLKAAGDINLVDFKVYSYPSLVTVNVDDSAGQPILMNSFHPVLVMEALAPSPDKAIPNRDRAKALNTLFEQVKLVARAFGIKEVIFHCKDESLIRFIEKNGFERVPFPTFRYKLED
jgi:hypothetical protein